MLCCSTVVRLGKYTLCKELHELNISVQFPDILIRLGKDTLCKELHPQNILAQFPDISVRLGKDNDVISLFPKNASELSPVILVTPPNRILDKFAPQNLCCKLLIVVIPAKLNTFSVGASSSPFAFNSPIKLSIL